MNPLHFILRTTLFILCIVFGRYNTLPAQRNFNSNGIHFPFLKQKNDVNLSVGYLGSDELSGFTFSAAYSPVKQLGLIANFWNGAKSTTAPYNYKANRQFELGIGTYQETGKLTLNTFAGLGGGVVKIADTLQMVYDINFMRLFGQGNLMHVGKTYYFGTSLRINYMRFRKANINVSYQYFYEARQIEKNNPSLQPEIGIIAGAKGKKMYIDGSIAYFHRRVEPLRFARVVYRLAVGYYFNTRTKKDLKRTK